MNARPSRGLSALLIDLDGVIRTWDPRIMASAEVRYGLETGLIARTAFDETLLAAAVTGTLSDSQWRHEIVRRLAEEHSERAAHAVAQWSAAVGEVDREVLGLVQRFRRDHRVGLVSNATSRLERDLTKLGISDEFDHVFNSSRLGVAKPAAGIFWAACDTLGVRPEECAFVDDTAGHVAAAASLGMVVHHFHGAAHLASFLGDHGC